MAQNKAKAGDWVYPQDAADEIERLRSRSETLEAALRATESAFVLLTKTMQGSEIAIPLDVGFIIVNAREVARAAMSKENDVSDDRPLHSEN
jgi:hypothetical protein